MTDLATAHDELRPLMFSIAYRMLGGGKAPAIRTPMRGLTQVARFLLGLNRAAKRAGITVEPVQTNGQPGARFLSRDGSLLGVMSLEIAGGCAAPLLEQMPVTVLQNWIPRPKGSDHGHLAYR